MKTAVIGSNGQLGSDVCSEFSKNGFEVIKLNHADIEVSDIDSVSAVLKNIKPDIVINTAAMHNVEKCEADPVKSFTVNGNGARNLAVICNETGSVLVHISTDYVFDGLKNAPYTETDNTSPLNVYGNTKVSGEMFIKSVSEKYFIARTSGIYGLNPCRAKGGLNFVELMLKLANEKPELRVVDDEILTPTSTKEIARQLVRLVKTGSYGLYHATAGGNCSWFEFAEKIFAFSGLKPVLKRALPGEFPMKVPRPKYSVLENSGLKNAGINIFKSWDEALKEYLSSRSA
jgi:dTDP-4-dehydrorhamnose reductase